MRSKLRTSAIDGEFDAGDVRRIVRRQKSDCHRNLLGFAEAFRRDLLKERFTERQNIRFGSCDRCYHSSTPGAHRNN